MDPLLPLLCLLVGIALPVTVLFVPVRRVVRQLRVAGAYRDVSTRLDLDVDTRGLSLHGHLAGRRIWVGEVMVGHGPSRTSELRGVVTLRRPLGLGLHVTRRRTRRWFRRGRAPEQATGIADLDRLLVVRADDAERVRRLLGSGVDDALRAVLDRWPELEVTDEDVRVFLKHPEESPAGLQALVDALTGLAGALEEGRREVPPPEPLRALVPEWEELAARLGLTLDPWIPAVHGTLDGRRVHICARRGDDGYEAELAVWFRPHPELGLRLRPQLEPDGYWSVGQDIQVGHPRFDAAFIVKGYDPTAIRAQLGDRSRAHLLALARVGPLEVDDRLLHLRGAPLDAGLLEAALREACAAAAALGW